MFHATLALLVRENEVCLGIKKQKLGKGKYNAFGGRQEPGETIEEAFLRELREESDGVKALLYEKVGEIAYYFPKQHEWEQTVHIYLVEQWEGTPKETDEMGVEWFSFDQIPYHNMWENDRYWLPLVLEGKKVKGSVIHDGDTMLEKNIEVVESC